MAEDPPNKKVKKSLSPKQMESKKQRDSLRRNMFLRMKEEESLRIGMSIRDIALKEQGFDVKQDEDKSEKYEFDAYKHAKQVKNGEIIYPSRPPSVGRSVSSNDPVRETMRNFTRKTITKVITVLEEKVRNEYARQKVDMYFKTSYSRNDRAARRAKAIMQNSLVQKS